MVLDHRSKLSATGELEERRRDQNRAWMWNLVDQSVAQAFRNDPGVAAAIPALERDVEQQKISPAAAARELLAAFESRSR
jgi:LAO/AO transport system kinase